MMVPDSFGWFVGTIFIAGYCMILGVLLPALCSGFGFLSSRIFTGDWITSWALVGGAVGLIPFFIISIGYITSLLVD